MMGWKSLLKEKYGSLEAQPLTYSTAAGGSTIDHCLCNASAYWLVQDIHVVPTGVPLHRAPEITLSDVPLHRAPHYRRDPSTSHRSTCMMYIPKFKTTATELPTREASPHGRLIWTISSPRFCLIMLTLRKSSTTCITVYLAVRSAPWSPAHSHPGLPGMLLLTAKSSTPCSVEALRLQPRSGSCSASLPR